MQIDIRVLPSYEKGFKGHFPKLGELFRGAGYREKDVPDVSLYDLIDLVVSMSRDPLVSREQRQRVAPHAEGLLELKREAREHLLARRLNALDAALYRIEDAFEELEGSL
jgi:hypothetical protein